MFNVTGSEIVIVLLLALVVLGPEKLPDAVRRFAKTYAELKKVGAGFQQEFRSAMDEPMREMRETADLLRSSADFGAMADAAMSTTETKVEPQADTATTADTTDTATTTDTTDTTATTDTATTTDATDTATTTDAGVSSEPATDGDGTAPHAEDGEPAEPVADVAEVSAPERPRQIWSAAPPYRIPPTTTDVAPEAAEPGAANDAEQVAADGAEDRSA